MSATATLPERPVHRAPSRPAPGAGSSRGMAHAERAAMAARRRAVVRRRRVGVLVFTVAALFGAVRAVAAFGVGPASDAERRPPIHVVQPGETLWSIASSLRPDGDVRALVRTLQRLNGVGTDLQVGQRLELPESLRARG